MPDETLTKYQVAEWLGVSHHTVEKWSLDGSIPFSQAGRLHIRKYHEPEIAGFVMAARVGGDELVQEVLRKPLLTKAEVAERLRTSIVSVVQIAKHGGMIPRVEFRFNVIRYHPDDVTRYILANKDRGEVNRYGESELADFTSKLRLAMGTQLEAGQQLLTVSEAARLLGVGLSRMRALGDQGVVPWVRLRPLDSVRFDLADVQEAIERRRGPVRRTALPGGES